MLLYKGIVVRFLLPFCIFLIVGGFLWKGLQLDPKTVPAVIEGSTDSNEFIASVDQNPEELQEIYPFSIPEERNLFSKLTHELRCSVCQNQTLAEAMAPLSVDLRNIIYQKVRSGQSEQQIIEFVTNRYGEFVLYRPPLNGSTVFLWVGPFVILLLGLFFLANFVKRK